MLMLVIVLMGQTGLEIMLVKFMLVEVLLNEVADVMTGAAVVEFIVRVRV